MVNLNYPKSPHPLHTFSNKRKKSSSLITTMKLKTLINNLIFSHISHVVRAMSKAKSFFLEAFRENHLKCIKQSPKRDKYMKNLLFGSFRLHYNFCSSSHVMPIPSPTTYIDYYDSTWNSSNHDRHEGHFCNSGTYDKEEEEGQLNGYLQWLEEKRSGKVENSSNSEGTIENEIDKLADMFIASCHEKFRLEKIESYRRFHEMLVRSM